MTGFPSALAMTGFPSALAMTGFPSALAMAGFPSALAMTGFPSALAMALVRHRERSVAVYLLKLTRKTFFCTLPMALRGKASTT